MRYEIDESFTGMLSKEFEKTVRHDGTFWTCYNLFGGKTSSEGLFVRVESLLLKNGLLRILSR